MIELSIALFAGTIAVIELLTGATPGREVTAVVAAVVAGTFVPMAKPVRSVLDEIVFGRVPDPLTAISDLGAELAAGGGPQTWVTALRDALEVARVELWDQGELAAMTGTGGSTRVVTPLIAEGQTVGELVVVLPENRTRLHPLASTVLTLVAAPVARALYGNSLATKLRESQGHLVAAVEEERRRLRHDLHDSLGPVLTGLAFSTDAARNYVGSDPDATRDLLDTMRIEITGALDEVRRIVEALRPPALDEVGLVEAVRLRTARLLCSDGRRLRVELGASEPLPSLPAAVEVAAYRIAVEAVVNVARHSGSDRATVTFDCDGRVLRVRVTDTGTNSGPWTMDVGLESIHERAQQVAGHVVAEPTEDGGRVVAELPLTLPGSHRSRRT